MSIQWHGGQPGPLPGHSPVMRASHADRERAADVLKAGYAEGRLGQAEYDQRLTRVHQAATYGELNSLISDLPQGPMPLPVPVPVPAPMPAYQAVPRTFHPYPVYPSVPLPPTNGSATGALICGVLTPVTWGVTAIPAVVLGHKAKAEIRRSGERGEGYATAGLVLGYLTIGFGVLFVMLMMLAGT